MRSCVRLAFINDWRAFMKRIVLRSSSCVTGSAFDSEMQLWHSLRITLKVGELAMFEWERSHRAHLPHEEMRVKMNCEEQESRNGTARVACPYL